MHSQEASTYIKPAANTISAYRAIVISGICDETEDREEREDEQRTLLALKTTLEFLCDHRDLLFNSH